MAYRPMTKEEVDAEVAYLKSFTLDKPPPELGVNPTSYIDMQVRHMYALGFHEEALGVLDFHGYTKSPLPAREVKDDPQSP